MATDDLDLLDLARAFVALPCWEWRGGMRVDGRLYIGHAADGHPMRVRVSMVRDGKPVVITRLSRSKKRGTTAEVAFFDGDPLPDLTDPATLGAILGLLRERAGEHGYQLTTSYDGDGWAGCPDGHVWGMTFDYQPEGQDRLFAALSDCTGPTEPHALYAALAAVAEVCDG